MAKSEKLEDSNELVVVFESLTNELKSIKNLLVLQALALGCQQKHVAATLGVSDATLSRMFPKGFAKEIAKVANRGTKDILEDR